MPIDARLPLLAAQGAQVNLGELFQQQQAMQQRQQAMDMQRQQFEFQQRQAQLKALGDLDEQKRKAVDKGLEDIAAAIQWADTPDKWAVVQRHYAQYDPQLANVPFEQREQALVTVGHMSDYLKNTAEKFQSVEQGGGLYGIKPNGAVREVIHPNPGDQQFGSPVSSGGTQEGATATNPQTGAKIVYRNGQWVPMGGGVSNGTSGFPGAGG